MKGSILPYTKNQKKIIETFEVINKLQALRLEMYHLTDVVYKGGFDEISSDINAIYKKVCKMIGELKQ